MGYFFKFLFRLIFYIAFLSAFTSIILLFPYYMEVKSATNMIALQVAHDGYYDSALQKTTLNSLESGQGLLGNSTIKPGTVLDPARGYTLLPSFTNINPLEVKVYRTSDSGGNEGELESMSSEQAEDLITAGLNSGIPPLKSKVLQRDDLYTVVIRTNFRAQTAILGQMYVAQLPITVSTNGLSIKQYRW